MLKERGIPQNPKDGSFVWVKDGERLFVNT
jgi:hypothetical protein